MDIDNQKIKDHTSSFKRMWMMLRVRGPFKIMILLQNAIFIFILVTFRIMKVLNLSKKGTVNCPKSVSRPKSVIFPFLKLKS